MSEAIQTIDLHGQNVYQAKVRIESALRRSWGVYIIRLIHGYHSGTAIRDFIYENYIEDPRIIELVQVNPGMTELYLREL